MRTDLNTDTTKVFARVIDTIPYVSVLVVPFAWAVWAMGTPGNATPEQIETSWWFKGYVALLLYIPAMAICGLGEWASRRWNWPRLKMGIRLFRWTYFLVAIGPIIVLVAAIFIPPLGRLIEMAFFH